MGRTIYTNRMKDSLDDHIEGMKNIANHLVQYSFPSVPFSESKDVDCLKQRTIFLDGYYVGVHFGRSDFGDYYLEKLELVGLYSPFLPMCLICKIATRFLGGYGLRLTEQFRVGRKIYTWDVRLDKTGRPALLEHTGVKHRVFEGLHYSYAEI